jgi:hypothetical protein
MPVESSQELMSAIGADGVDADGELVDHVIDKRDRTMLFVSPVDA